MNKIINFNDLQKICCFCDSYIDESFEDHYRCTMNVDSCSEHCCLVWKGFKDCE